MAASDNMGIKKSEGSAFTEHASGSGQDCITVRQLQQEWEETRRRAGKEGGEEEVGEGEDQRVSDVGRDSVEFDVWNRGGPGRGGFGKIFREARVGRHNSGWSNSDDASTTVMLADSGKFPEYLVEDALIQGTDEWTRNRVVREIPAKVVAGGGGGGEGAVFRKPRVGDPSPGLISLGVTTTMIKDSCNLPEHLIESVLARLPVRSLFRFRSVCKSWNSLLHSTTFLKAYSDAEIRHKVWFVVTDNLARLGRYGHHKYDPEYNNWHRIPLPAPLCDLNPYPTAADGGLVCYFVYENRLRTLFVCNPLTKSLRKLPLVLKTSSHISVLKMVMEDRSTSAYKVFVAGMVPGENGNDSLSMEVYDSASDRWSTSGIIPARYPKRRPVYGNGVLYVRCSDQRSLLLTYDLKEGAWNKIHAPLPHTLGIEELVQYQGHILLVGVLGENYKYESVCIWELLQDSHSSIAWKQVDTMPRDLFMEFFCDREYFECQDDERVLMKCCQYGDLILCVAFSISHRGPFKVLAYDLAQKRWRRLPDSFKARECRTHKFIEGIIYEPRLDVIA